MTAQIHDVAIAGAGLTGLVLATALNNKVKPHLNVVLCGDPKRHMEDPRAYAIAPGVRRMLEQLGIWARLGSSACPVAEMRIGDSRLEDVVRPAMLSLSRENHGGEPVAHIVPAGDLAQAAYAQAQEVEVVIEDIGTFEALEINPGHGSLKGSAGPIQARLIVGADGMNSFVRAQAGIKTVSWPYNQSGVVATLKAQKPHQNIAFQHFLPDGPFALLPLEGERYSLVSSMPTDKANALAGENGDAFIEQIEQRAGRAIGPLSLETRPVAFPLTLSIARDFIAPRVALAGDAAHRLHPLAGQGQNMGLRDVAALAQTLVEAVRLGEDIGSVAVLKRYEQWRRFDTVQLAMVTEGINRLFSNDIAIMRAVRDAGLGLVDRMAGLKSALVRDAGGAQTDAPRLLQGLAL